MYQNWHQWPGGSQPGIPINPMQPFLQSGLATNVINWQNVQPPPNQWQGFVSNNQSNRKPFANSQPVAQINKPVDIIPTPVESTKECDDTKSENKSGKEAELAPKDSEEEKRMNELRQKAQQWQVQQAQQAQQAQWQHYQQYQYQQCYNLQPQAPLVARPVPAPQPVPPPQPLMQTPVVPPPVQTLNFSAPPPPPPPQPQPSPQQNQANPVNQMNQGGFKPKQTNFHQNEARNEFGFQQQQRFESNFRQQQPQQNQQQQQQHQNQQQQQHQNQQQQFERPTFQPQQNNQWQNSQSMQEESQGCNDRIAQLERDEVEFERQFTEWTRQFEKWREQNKFHPDRAMYAQYEQQYHQMHEQLRERRERMRQLKEQARHQVVENKTANNNQQQQQTNYPNRNQDFSRIRPTGNYGTTQYPVHENNQQQQFFSTDEHPVNKPEPNPNDQKPPFTRTWDRPIEPVAPEPIETFETELKPEEKIAETVKPEHQSNRKEVILELPVQSKQEMVETSGLRDKEKILAQEIEALEAVRAQKEKLDQLAKLEQMARDKRTMAAPESPSTNQMSEEQQRLVKQNAYSVELQKMNIEMARQQQRQIKPNWVESGESDESKMAAARGGQRGKRGQDRSRARGRGGRGRGRGAIDENFARQHDPLAFVAERGRGRGRGDYGGRGGNQGGNNELALGLKWQERVLEGAAERNYGDFQDEGQNEFGFGGSGDNWTNDEYQSREQGFWADEFRRREPEFERRPQDPEQSWNRPDDSRSNRPLLERPYEQWEKPVTIDYGHRPAAMMELPPITNFQAPFSRGQIQTIDYAHGQKVTNIPEVLDYGHDRSKPPIVKNFESYGEWEFERRQLDEGRNRFRDKERRFERNFVRDRSRERPRDDFQREREREREKYREEPKFVRGHEPSCRPLFPHELMMHEEANFSSRTETVLIEDLLAMPGRNKRPQRLVIVLRGPPGSGKTFVAKLIKEKEMENGGSAPRILCLDDYFMVETDKIEMDPETGKKAKIKVMQYEYEPEMEDFYYSNLAKVFKKTILDAFFPFVIVDAINDKCRLFDELWTYAKQNGFQVFVAELDRDAAMCHKRNIHNRSLDSITRIIKNWDPTPRHYVRVDIRSLLQDAAIPEVEMEDFIDEEKLSSKKDGDKISESALEDEDGSNQEAGLVLSRWEQMEATEERLDKLDGLRSMKRRRDEPQSLEDYLQLPDDYEQRESQPGKKRVRWADVEEQKDQDRCRALGFVVGQTNWDKITDPNHAEKALTRTKYI